MIDADFEISQKRFGSSNYGDKIANITIPNRLDKFENGISKERVRGKVKIHKDRDHGLTRGAGLF